MPRYKPGDRVILRGKGNQSAVWEVEREDTNRTPIRDPEPAYLLQRLTPHDRHYYNKRYAYESDLEPAPLPTQEGPPQPAQPTQALIGGVARVERSATLEKP